MNSESKRLFSYLLLTAILAIAGSQNLAARQTDGAAKSDNSQASNSLGGLPSSGPATDLSQGAFQPTVPPKASQASDFQQGNGFQQGFEYGFQIQEATSPSVGSGKSQNTPRVAIRTDRAPSSSDRPAENATASFIDPAGREFAPGTVMADVGGYPIFRADVMADINQLIEANMAAAPESIKAQQRELALPIAVDRAIEQKLLFVDAIRSLPEPEKLAEVKQSIRDQFAELRLPELLKNLDAKTPAEAETRLRKLGTSLRQARESWVNGQLAGFFVRDKININPEITHFEMLEYYNEHREDFHFPAQVRWEQIMVRFDRFPSRQEAWQRLGELGNEVVYGANFVAVARKSSQGFEAEKGGYHDWTTQGSLVHEKVDEALFSLPVNRLSDRIESKTGFHIVRVIERKNEGHVSFSKCQAEIRKKIKSEKQNAALKEYVEKLKQEIPVEKFVSQADPTQPR
ncbi:MAG: peptidylprolyl isomerase [Planctomycetota bacterium]|nr:peptidylprolyl isomerase [Planctomycetota bacterium]